jgi:hypothetical protein
VYGKALNFRDLTTLQGRFLMSDSQELTYTANVTTDELDRVTDELWASLQRADSALAKEAVSEGISLSNLAGISRTQAITFSHSSAGFGPETTAIVVALAPVAAGIVRDLWEKIILPRLRQRLGHDALKEK